jgi:hypothetical protein
MQEKRNKQQIIVFLVLLAGLVAALTFKPGGSGFDIPADYYREFNLREVDRIVMRSPEKEVSLRVDRSRWLVNDDFPADRGLVEVLFATLQQAEPKRPVASSIRDSLARTLREKGVQVTLFTNNDQVGAFFAGGNAAKTQAYFLKEGDDQPHLMVIPGYRVYVSGIFELPAIQWREKLIFDFNWTTFRKLETTFRNPAGNFTVEMARNHAVISGVAEPDTARLNTFLDELSLLRAEEYLERNSLLDSIAKSRALAEYRIADIGGRIYSLKVFEFGEDFVGLTHQGQFAVLPRNDLVTLLRPKEFFVKR